MAINPTAAAYITNQPDTNAAVVDIDVKGAENNSNRSSGRALVVTISGTLNPDGSYSPGFTGSGNGSGGTVPTGPAGTPNSSVVTVQGITGGTPQAVSGDAIPGNSSPSTAFYIAGFDGTAVRPILTNSAGAVGFYLATNSINAVSRGASTMATGQVSVGTTSTQIVAARTLRGSVKITDLSTVDIYIGNTGVTTTTGDLLPGTRGASITVPASVALFGIAAATGASVSFMDVY